jgi:hypothetical protein
MAEHGYFHASVGYWQATDDPSEEAIAAYPVGYTEVPLKPGEFYDWNGSAWVEQPLSAQAIIKRLSMPNLNAAEVRIAMIKNGIAPSAMAVAIAALPNGLIKSVREVQWEYKPTFSRLHPLMELLRTSIGLTPEQFDAEWLEALADPEG